MVKMKTRIARSTHGAANKKRLLQININKTIRIKGQQKTSATINRQK